MWNKSFGFLGPRNGRWGALEIHLRKEVNEQRSVLLGIPLICVVGALAAQLGRDPEAMGFLPGLLSGFAACAAAMIFGSDLFAGELRRGHGAFLARTPRAVDSALCAKFVLLLGAVPLLSLFGWTVGLCSVGAFPGVIDVAIPWLPAIGCASWLAAFACLVRAPGLALLGACLPLALIGGAAAYGLQGVQLESGWRSVLGSLASGWVPWALAVTPLCLALIFRWRVGAEQSRAVWLPVVAMAIVPAVGVGSFVLDWRRFECSDRASLSGVFVTADGQHAVANVTVDNEHGSTTHALVLDLVDGSSEQLGGPGESILPSEMTFGITYRQGGHEYANTLGTSVIWIDGRGERVAAPGRTPLRQAAFAALPRYTEFARGLSLAADGYLMAKSRSGTAVRWAEWPGRFGHQGESLIGRVAFDSREPLQLSIHRPSREVDRFDLVTGDRIMAERPGLGRGRTIALATGNLFVSFDRRRRSQATVCFWPRGGGERVDLNFAPGTTVGWVLDEERIAVVSQVHTRHSFQSIGGEVLGWLNPSSGERGTFPWLKSGEKNLALQICRGEAVRDLLLLIGRTGKHDQLELVWDDAQGVARVPLARVATINLWTGGDAAIVSDAHSIRRIWRDGRNEVLFTIGVER